ncbi:15745_t:CDS:2, partial [Dentiscutata heterogama]
CWVSLSLSVKQLFAITFPKDDYLEMLSGVLKKSQEYLIKNYRTLVNTACGIKETMHSLFKAFVLYTNKKNINLVLLRHYNTLQALQFWLDGRQDEHVPDSDYSNYSLLKLLLLEEYITKLSNLINDVESEGNETNSNLYLLILQITFVI